MPNVLKKAIGAVKDQTSISLAKVSNFSNLDVAVLKATTHEEVPVEDRYINEVILLTSSSKNYAAACAQAIAKRIGRTRNWVVALKSLMLVQRIFQNGDPHFPWVVLHAMRRGSKILNLSSFRDDSNRSPWDYTGFVRTFALYLDERLDCLRMGKLHRRPPYRERVPHKRGRRCNEPVCDLKMPMLLDRISYWQRLLDRAIATRPTGPAKTNRLVQISLYSVIRESFDLYRDICDGLSLLHDNSTHMQHQSCVDALQICVKASKQFQELHGFYTLCKSIGVGRTSEYPRVQKVYDEIIGTLQEFLEGQISCPIGNGRPQLEACEQSKTSEQHERRSEKKVSEKESEVYEQQTTLKDLISVSNAEISTFVSTDGENCLEKVEKQSQTEDFMGVREVGNQGRYSGLDLVNFDDQPQQEELQHPSASGLAMDERDGWELVLAETTTNMSSTQASCNLAGGFESSFANSPCNQASLHEHHPNYNNPFLQDTNGINATYTIAPAIVSVADTFPSIHTFPATPMFSGNNSDEATVSSLNIENDLFMPCTPPTNVDHNWDMSMNQPHLLHEQQLWLQQQNKIMARLVT